MPHPSFSRPEPDEHTPYYETYIRVVPGNDVLSALKDQVGESLALLRGVSEDRAGHRYAPDKWSVRELLGHVIDTERIFSYRALCFARNDSTPLPGYEQDDYIRNAAFDSCRLADLASEFAHVRQATLYLFRHLDTAAWLRRGLANDSPFSVRALAWILAGHELHHMRILRERYL